MTRRGPTAAAAAAGCRAPRRRGPLQGGEPLERLAEGSLEVFVLVCLGSLWLTLLEEVLKAYGLDLMKFFIITCSSNLICPYYMSLMVSFRAYYRVVGVVLVSMCIYI